MHMHVYIFYFIKKNRTIENEYSQSNRIDKIRKMHDFLEKSTVTIEAPIKRQMYKKV